MMEEFSVEGEGLATGLALFPVLDESSAKKRIEKRDASQVWKKKSGQTLIPIRFKL